MSFSQLYLLLYEKIRNSFWRFLNKRSWKKNKEISLRYPHHYYRSIILSPKTEYPKTKLKKKEKEKKEEGILHVLSEITKTNRLTTTGYEIPFFMYGF